MITRFYTIIMSGCLVLLSGCTGCSKSGRFGQHRGQVSSPRTTVPAENKSATGGKTVVRMLKDGGIYKIPVKVNGADMSFIFDTGAGLISISSVEASYLYKQGTLTADDIEGQAKFMDANGDISVGTIIRLKEVAIGDRKIHNVQASVVHNSVAPLLFGQSALEQFGSISIDYKKGTITFE
ncbi:retropepsin-like aspartic protease family protein [Chitinophaga qingshengii]|uniref:Retroviral-like aspartic protease family protein n=1 Tax=Chitinophaga qingshengii TaxID=1569794 RepID=A0ABR7TUM1_9BACT|nr:retropepsin-like aspartic protease [Chitinophaga qingshengii]MBC9934189.1 retroviral-like aspartic protease family protein [Chitinophaga qingshengii]